MTNEELIHVKLEVDEAVEGKKETLLIQAEMLRLLKIMKRYHKARSLEFALKLKIHSKINSLLADIKRLQTNLPKIKIHEIEIQKYEPKHTRKPATHKEKIAVDDEERTIDKELADIQAKLRKLAG